MTISRHLRLALAAFTLALASPALAQQSALSADRPGVVELFTSQGCSSCPPADANLAEFAQRTDIIALAYHVDYWDYLGWRDTLASPENTRRQQDYAAALGQRSVYTPQAVINGMAHRNGADKTAIEGLLAETTQQTTRADLSIRKGADSIIIEATRSGGHNEKVKASLLLVFFDARTVVKIPRGENAGKNVAYWNAVTGIQTAGMWHGEDMRLEIPMSEVRRKGTGGCAALLQSLGKDGAPGAIIGAAVLKHPGM
ncbi:DUF1223 domain-containing protein [Aquibium carbonis]|uniref:DUF1223 domain-containing protein n=1 Tax=Aquibium carbonis TaxID=2495581 RepID=A0A429Z3N3_9HYPH|nr:DUF1223 domain-containing protein [Aquibium carbonis]RST88278.1 DUF1223 domain-containing protein [Aquibium carbonis]